MNKGELIKVLAHGNVSKAEVARLLDSVVHVITTTLESGEDVRLVGFGTFKTIHFAPRKVRNPQNGQEMMLQSGRRVRFVPGKRLKDVVGGTSTTTK